MPDIHISTRYVPDRIDFNQCIISEPSANIQPSNNTTAQKQSNTNLQKAKAELCEYANLSRVTTSSELHTQFSSKIKYFEKSMLLEKKTLKWLRGNAEAQKRARNKKRKMLEKENIVKMYNTLGCPSFLINKPNLLENMHNSIEFGIADHKRHKEDDKAKVPLGIAAVEKTFKAIQTVNEPVFVPDHDFLKGSKHKLIPSVYLMINPDNTNDSLRSDKMRIFIQPEYFLGTSCETHMVDLITITEEESFHEFTYYKSAIKPI
ncbi:hypothetical protein RhiirA5_437152 [Rhizophagus irregularis]|uniref:Uncharacterized protein n=1 Tax=Rhizophagus irregularis TaxID=588596 RepID=A0A2N0NKW4_9GLOM|nr:hypothetical protein RhiirA5_437152 [Rhizophagus irregularis]